ncbi:MAG: TldD/PmbA family protein [Ferrimicrobium sp.]
MLDQNLVEQVLEHALRNGGDFAELFFERKSTSSAAIDDGRISDVADSGWTGVGIRVIIGETTGFAHTTDLGGSGLLAAAETASAVARTGSPVNVRLRPDHTAEANDSTIQWNDKRRSVALLQDLDTLTRSRGDQIVQVSGGIGSSKREILVANSLGTWAHNTQYRNRVMIVAVAQGDGGLQTGYDVYAHTVDLATFLDDLDLESLSATAARRAITKLSARPAPAGTLPVILERGSGGILFHEACGHGLEADHIVKSASVYAGRMGDIVASPLVTLVDDGTIDREWGTYAIDDEGHPAQRNVLIDKGVLVDYMMDYRSAKSFDHGPQGNGRRESYRDLPMVRMTNTFLMPGETNPADLIADTDYGVYVAALSGGQVNTTTGDFVFGTHETYLIENGEITTPLRDTQLIGNGPEILARIDAVGNDFGITPGTCGKNGQSVPVGTGQPTLRISAITLGGTVND